MEASILKSTKKVLGIADSYTVFDQDILMHLNATFATLSQIGIGPSSGFFVEDEFDEWDDLNLTLNQTNMVRTYVYLKVRMLFDQPGTSFLIEAMNKQIAEAEWRLNVFREYDLHPLDGL